MQDTVTGGQENQLERPTVTCRHSQDFLDANGNLHELYAVKKHFGIQEEGDPDLFFDVTQERQKEQQDELIHAAIDSELSGENHGGTSDLLTALSGVVDIDVDNDPAPENVPTVTTAPLSFPINGDMQGFVSVSSRVLETLQQNLSSLLT